MRLGTLLGYLLVLSCVAFTPGLAKAAPFVGLDAPLPGYEADDGTQLWYPDTAVVGIELYDLFGALPRYESSFGFYRPSNSSELITIFSEDDQTSGGDAQLAWINFETGQVYDVDDAQWESFFTPGMEEIGFFLNVFDTVTATEFTLYTQPALNTAIGGADAFGSFRNTDNPDQYLLGAELGEYQLALRLDVIDGVNPIPEPSSAVVFAAGFVVVTVAMRMKGSSSIT